LGNKVFRVEKLKFPQVDAVDKLRKWVKEESIQRVLWPLEVVAEEGLQDFLYLAFLK
jgi:hypothetical protein